MMGANLQLRGVVIDLIAALGGQFQEVSVQTRLPATVEQLEVLEAHLGVEIPEELRELLQIMNGEDSESPTLLGGRIHILSSEGIATTFHELCQLAARSGRLDQDLPDQMAAIGPVRPCYWSRNWIPFMDVDRPWAIDICPAAGGKVGQIISVGWEDFEVRVEFESLAELFGEYLAVVMSGERRFTAAMKV